MVRTVKWNRVEKNGYKYLSWVIFRQSLLGETLCNNKKKAATSSNYIVQQNHVIIGGAR